MIILNTGGTFNKIYDPIKGELIVPQNNDIVHDFLKKNFLQIEIQGLIYKDSLEFSDEDRELLLQAIKNCNRKRIVIVHGTDTMDKSAAFVAPYIHNQCVVFTGAMVPYSIDPVEASANLALAIAKVRYTYEDGVFIAMHGIVDRYDRVYKDRARGVFCQK
ncbi:MULTISPECIES: asparaginase domain-containing protein [unclassified Nitratiruptor]|uniref:asparaginase domain-containing protein n=1 Tax=unclassified Nitratiruptor TaxID=2624044 RepID=UPI0019151F53|nr:MULTISPECIES: asparaginase domain-containing protein [unclassified Nitratiruptor]BCD60755.1 L-asparaginase [Nitratiruptor sp. YY08-10]BCD64687.1 L-asparaginase [Nitratiruptor sp. YY08-14]